MKPLLLAFALCAAPLSAQQCTTPDTVFYNGNILTGVGLQPRDQRDAPQRVEALSSANGKILLTGTNATVRHCADPKTTKLVDLHGAFVLPGFNDAHTHIAGAGQQKLSVDLDNIPSLAAMQDKIKTYAATLAPGQWIQGGGWDHTKWASHSLPTAHDLDLVTGDHPAYLERTDGHIAVVNTAALRAAGITGKTLAPQGSSIDVDDDGNPTGILREDAARALVTAHIPKPDAATRRRALQLSIDDALTHGVTSVQDFSDWDDFLVLEQMERDHALHLRVSEWLTFNDSLDTLKAERAHHNLNDPLLKTAMLKGFMDGSLGSRTAALAAPYADDPTNSGLPRYDQTKLTQMAADRADAGLQLGFHAIGDNANTIALDAFRIAEFSQALGKCYSAHTGPFPRKPPTPCENELLTRDRFRIEHAQVLLPADFDRFHQLHIIASMQPSHLLTDMAWAEQRLGPERSNYAYAWKSFLDHGVTLAFGTDYPVESISPFRGLYSAVTRSNEADTQTFHPEQRLTIHQAIYAYTQASAFAQFEEKRKGILAPGYLADFVVLDHDLTTSTPQQILHTQVLRTVLNGETVYLAP
ncbi:amidohydrolase [Granulicella paludicola]|uniref:amidohydrolase n=1 Tax=Granulicella paludicola TaxID=474951 RepID=UPI0021DFB615|nr:amidohydrolase [Granulicella paludicola]